MDIIKELSKIQASVKAPKGQLNKFGNYKYRSCEDILEAIKPLLGEGILQISDTVVLIGERYYVKAVASYRIGESDISSTGYARESDIKKGMDSSQITGAASSYARKYALNGLFCIDDTKDADATNNHGFVETKNVPIKDYIVPVGKFKGQALSEIVRDDLVDYCTYMSKRAKDDNKPLDGKMKEFIDNARVFIQK